MVPVSMPLAGVGGRVVLAARGAVRGAGGQARWLPGVGEGMGRGGGGM